LQLCVALDMQTRGENLALVKDLKGLPLWLKVGMRSFIRDGEAILDAIKNIDEQFKIFIDLKLYDIPNTMADGAESLCALGVDMITIHASSGREGLKAVVERVREQKNRPLVMAVTALTSFDDEGFCEIYGGNLEEKIYDFAKLAYECEVDGVVSSVHESRKIKSCTHERFLTLTPGIRPFGENAGDQKRVADIQMAKEALSDFAVVGRPIYESKNPKDTVLKILEIL